MLMILRRLLCLGVEGWRKDPNLGFSPPLTGHIDPMLLPLRHAFEAGY